MAYPREGKLNQLYHMFAYLRIKHTSSPVFDPSEPDIFESQFSHKYWSARVYGDCSEDIPTNMPKPCGIGFTTQTFVDSDHAGELTTWRSCIIFIVYLNSAPI